MEIRSEHSGLKVCIECMDCIPRSVTPIVYKDSEFCSEKCLLAYKIFWKKGGD